MNDKFKSLLEEFTKAIIEMETKDKENNSIALITGILKTKETSALLQDEIRIKLRGLFKKEKFSDEDKKACVGLLTLLLELSSDDVVSALTDRDETIKKIKNKFLDVVKLLVSLGVLLIT